MPEKNDTVDNGDIKDPIVMERTYQAPVSAVWKALTDKAEMKKWYFDVSAFRPEAGFEFEFTAGSKENKYRHLCKVMEVIPERKLSYTWRYDGYESNSLLTFELFPEGKTTRLKLTRSGLSSFPKDSPDFGIQSFNKGWTQILGSSLKNYLES